MKELALSLGFKEEDLKGLNDVQIKAKCDEAIEALKNPDLQIAALVKEGYTITAKKKAEDDDEDEDEAKGGETKPAKEKAKADAGDDSEKGVSKAAHDKLKAAHDKLKDRVSDCENEIKKMKDKMKASTDGEISARVETKVTALVTAGKIADNDETKAIVRKNLTNDFDAFAPIYDAIPGKAVTAKAPGVNAVLDLAAKTKEENTKPAAPKKSAILAAMDEAEVNGKATEKAIK